MFVTSIEQCAYMTTIDHIKEIWPRLRTNADEANLWVWQHCVNSYGSKKLIFSPDTDVYHTGLTAVQHIPAAEVIVQLTKSYKDNVKFLCLNKLQQALHYDPDLT